MNHRLADVSCQRQGSEGSKEKVKPRGHSSGVIRNAPCDGDECDSRGGPPRQEFSSESVDGRNPGGEANEEKKAKREKIDAEKFKDSGVNIGKAAGIGIVEIAMRRFAVENPLGALAEGAFVVRNPSLMEVHPQVNAGGQPDKQENKRAAAGCGNGFLRARPFEIS
jgi:hypothetical protein